MITEDYCSFEISKLLKDKGFEVEITTFYYPSGTFSHGNTYSFVNAVLNANPDIIMAPSIGLAMKWLRKLYHLEIYPLHDSIQEDNAWWYRIERHKKGYSTIEHESEPIYRTYEKACEEAIQYCLENLI